MNELRFSVAVNSPVGINGASMQKIHKASTGLTSQFRARLEILVEKEEDAESSEAGGEEEITQVDLHIPGEISMYRFGFGKTFDIVVEAKGEISAAKKDDAVKVALSCIK